MEHAVILAGGKGERFWPMSRRGRPKQLLPIVSEKSLLEATIERVAPVFPPERTWVVTGEEITDAVRERCPQLPAVNILTEPASNNTCLAIGWAAAELLVHDPEATLAVLSADHAINPSSTFQRILREGLRLAQSEPNLITIGITPMRAETAYGYIELGSHFATTDGIASYQVEAFREKPDHETAQEYYYDRRHLWNAGIFVWTAKALLDALERYQPAMRAALDRYTEAVGSPRQKDALRELYRTTPCISIDNAVLELADNVLVIKADMSWDDVGSWLALDRIKKPNSSHNVIIGEALPLESYDTTIYNDSDDLVCTLGISDLVIVRTDRVTFIAHKSRLSEMKKVLEHLKADDRWEKYL